MKLLKHRGRKAVHYSVIFPSSSGMISSYVFWKQFPLQIAFPNLKVTRREIWLGISARIKIINNLTLFQSQVTLCWHLGYIIFGYQNFSTGLWSKIIFQGVLRWVWHVNSHLAVPVPHQKAGNNNSFVSEKYFTISSVWIQMRAR